MNVSELANNYIDRRHWRINENANIGYSFQGLVLNMAGNAIKEYLFENVYTQRIIDAHKNGDIHIHNLDMGIIGYCSGWSLRDLISEGLNGVPGHIESTPSKHFDTVIGQMINFLGTLQNEWAGAQAFNSFDTLLAPFVRKDNLTFKQVKQQLQQFIYCISTPSRWGCQTPFINLTFDLHPPKDMADQNVTMDGQYFSEFGKYGDFQKEMDIINKAFMEVMMEGDRRGRVFTFPIPTYNLTKTFDWDSDISNLLFEMTGKYGIPNFTNFINSGLDPSDVRSMCCRLRLSLKELRKNVTGGLFGSADSTGSVGVVTINLPRLGYKNKGNISGFFDSLDKLLDVAKISLETKRELVSKFIDKGFLPYTKRYLKNGLKNHFSTIGIVGANEMCINMFGKDLMDDNGRKFTETVLDFILAKIERIQVETKNLYNFEATPAEGSSYSLAKRDRELFSDIITAGTNESPYYTNSVHFGVGASDDIFEVFEKQQSLHSRFTGGSIVHGFMGESIDDPEQCKNLVRKLAERFTIPYFNITPTFSVCSSHGYIKGEVYKCPSCDLDTEVYSRVVGYLRPLSNWNKGKRQEFVERKEYKIVN